MQDRIDLENVKIIELEIMDVIHDFCKRNGIKYCLSHGTLIGAIRHRGYIPWDDDIDIMMPRPDYKQFCQTFPQFLKENDKGRHLAIYNAHTEPCFLRPFSKVIDTRTVVHEPEYVCDCQLGVFVDIWPVDGLPKTKWGKAYGSFCQCLIKKLFYVRIKKVGYLPWFTIPVHYLLSVLSVATWVKISEKLYERYAYETAEDCMSVMVPHIKKEWLNEVILIDFEGREFYIPKEYDQVLKIIYGDYMTLPPEDKRKPNHTLEAYWKTDESKTKDEKGTSC